LRFHRRRRWRVRGGDQRARLSAVVRAEHLQLGADARARPADHGRGAADLRTRRLARTIPDAVELTAAEASQPRATFIPQRNFHYKHALVIESSPREATIC